LVEGSRNVSQQEQKFTEKLEAEKEAFSRELVGLQDTLEDVKKYDSYKMVKDNASDVMGLRDRLEKA
jgi:predicted  nucleic acid-binding Zn-ribbon protein